MLFSINRHSKQENLNINPAQIKIQETYDLQIKPINFRAKINPGVNNLHEEAFVIHYRSNTDTDLLWEEPIKRTCKAVPEHLKNFFNLKKKRQQ